MKEQELIKNKTFQHFVKFQKFYLSLLTIILYLIIQYLRNPLYLGPETYYFLSQTSLNLPSPVVTIIPLILAISSIFLFSALAKRINLSREFSAVFMFLIVASPFFLVSLNSLSGYLVFTFLILLGFYLQKYKYVSFIPFILATFIDGLSSIFLLIFLSINTFYHKSEKGIFHYAKIFFVSIFFFINQFYLKTPFMLGPFGQKNILTDFVSDLGSQGGISFFAVVLALIGLALMWKKKKLYVTYLLLPIALIMYLTNTQTVFLLSIITLAFTATAFLRTFRQKWTYPLLKRLTFLIFLLGIIFSTIAFIDRIPEFEPTINDYNTLQWIRENTPENSRVFSTPDYSYYIESIAKRQSIEKPHKPQSLESTRIIIEEGSSLKVFQELSDRKVSYIFLNNKAKDQFPKNRGLLVFLQDESFKLIYQTETTEVWKFEPNFT